MDISANLDNVVKGVEWKDVVSTHEDVIQGQMRDTSNPPPPPPFHAGPDTHPQTGDSQTRGFGGCNLMGEASSVFQQQDPLLNTLSTTEPAQEGTGSQVQDCNIPVIPEDMVQYLRPVGYLKRKCPDQQDADHPYIKKPPNAFMLFLKEQRPKVASELSLTKSTAVNAIVGQRWKSLSKDQQAKYYQQADKERRLHAQQHPDWSTKDNYGKKRKRVRRRTLAAASKPEEVTPQLLSLTALPQHLSSPHTDLFTGPQAHQVSPACDVDPPASTLWDVTADEILSGDIVTEESLFSLLDQYEAPPHAAEPQ